MKFKREVEVVSYSDMVLDNGLTVRENNLQEKHIYNVDDLVEIKESGVRLFVVRCGRDCDGEPLYSLSYEKYEGPHDGPVDIFTRAKWSGGWSKDALSLVKRS